MIKGVKFVTIPVRDQDRALEFYTKKLGMRVITDSPYDDKQRWIELGIPRAETRVVLFTGSDQAQMIGGMMNITFVADDVEETARELEVARRRLCTGSAEGGLGDGRGVQGSGWKRFCVVDAVGAGTLHLRMRRGADEPTQLWSIGL